MTPNPYSTVIVVEMARRMANRGLLRVLLGAGALLLPGCFETGGGEEDLASSTGAATDTNSEPTCEPNTFASDCAGGLIVECSEEGLIQARECGPRLSCEIGSEGAGCVWRVGEACDSEYEQCRDPGGILACEDGFWRFEGCPREGACSDAECFGPEDTPCLYPDDEPRCEGSALVTCYPHGFEVTTPCGAAEVCQLGTMGGVCVADDAAACDPEAFTSTCSDVDEVSSCSGAGWTEEYSCADGDRCFESPLGATCQDEDTPACEPATAPATCDDGVAISCHPLGFETQEPCVAETECLVDESCIFGCQDVATCVPVDAEACEEPADAFCMGDALSFCFAGRVLPGFDCGCVEDEDGARCTTGA